MKGLITSAILAVSNIALMFAFSRDNFGPTPVMLPFAIAIIAVFLSIGFGTTAYFCYKKQDNWLRHLITSGIWIGLTAYNIWIFNEIMYVA